MPIRFQLLTYKIILWSTLYYFPGIKLCQESKLVNYSSNVQIKECLFQNYSIGTIYSKRYYSKKFIEELFHEQNSENEKSM